MLLKKPDVVTSTSSANGGRQEDPLGSLAR